MRSHKGLIVLMIAGSAIAIGACGGNTSRTAEQLGSHSIATGVAPPTADLITTREVNVTYPSSASRAFLSMWSSLQWQDWTDAISYYSPGLRQYIGSASLIQALEFNAVRFRTAKPKIESTAYTNGHTTLRYRLQGAQAGNYPSSITWGKSGGQWTIYYDPSLDSMMTGWAQAQTQQTSTPLSATTTARALAAGIHAGRLQSEYLSRHLGQGKH
jgi:hypothetical protein